MRSQEGHLLEEGMVLFCEQVDALSKLLYLIDPISRGTATAGIPHD